MTESTAPATGLDLTPDEVKLMLKALGFYQVRLFDESPKTAEDGEASPSKSEIQRTSVLIKRLHKFLETTRK